MTILSDVEIAEVARDAGWRDDRWPADRTKWPSELALAIAICIAESRGNTRALGTPLPDGRRAHGLWQILANPIDETLLDPNWNGKLAYSIYANNNRSFAGRWTAYDEGHHRAFVPRAEAAVRQTHSEKIVDRIPGVGAIDDALSGLKSVGEAVVFAVKWLFTGGFLRIGEAWAGAVLVLLGVVFVFIHTKPGAEAVSAAKGIATKGAAK